LALKSQFGDVLFQVPGFVWKQGNGRRYPTVAGDAGLLIPCRNVEGKIVALKVRRDDDDTGPKYRYISSTLRGGPGPGTPVHVPAGTAAPLKAVRLTEGELKADVATVLSGLPTISVPGVSNWRPAIEVLNALGAESVRLAIDTDCQTNLTVAKEFKACATGLVADGFSVELETWFGGHLKASRDSVQAIPKLPPEFRDRAKALGDSRGTDGWLKEAAAITLDVRRYIEQSKNGAVNLTLLDWNSATDASAEGGTFAGPV
jgi:hypothetical protein